MNSPKKPNIRKVLIASANPLFAKGLEKILRQKDKTLSIEVRSTAKLSETLHMMDKWVPDLIVLDYDDQMIDRSHFLDKFVQSDQPMQVMLVSLNSSGSVVVYDRKNLSPSEAENFLRLSHFDEPDQTPLTGKEKEE